MTVPPLYGHISIPVKRFLTCYRALSDGRAGIANLEKILNETPVLLSDWKISWIGTCAVLRSSIDLFKLDMKSCINEKIRNELRQEWKDIKSNGKKHQIFWEFLQKERNNILHEYEWRAYEAWMHPDGSIENAGSLLSIKPDDVKNVLIMRSGDYKERNTLDLLKESADWAEDRIFSAIRRAGYDPDEERNIVTFRRPEQMAAATILTQRPNFPGRSKPSSPIVEIDKDGD